MFPVVADMLSPARVSAIRRSFLNGRLLYRGIREHGPTDPGDLGVGTYFSTSKARARGYGRLTESVVCLKSPLVLSRSQAYALIDDHFETCRGDFEIRKWGAEDATRMLQGLGFDGLVAVDVAQRPGWRTEWEVVVFPPKQQ